MNDRFKFRAVIKTETHSLVVDCVNVLDTQYYIVLDDCIEVFEKKYPNDCFWEFLEKIEEQEHIQEISDDSNLIITNSFKNLMQCTGKKDKNDVLIYEGDICSDNNGELYQAYYYEQDTAICLKSCNGGIMRVCPDVIDLEIIGNIYENPELLEESRND